MAEVTPYYANLPGSYLFSEIARRVQAYVANKPDNRLIRLGIGDVTQPLPFSIVIALEKAVQEQRTWDGFRGYGPEQGYDFLREIIISSSFVDLGVSADEIFVSDGAKSDIGNFQELFSTGCKVAVTDPVYPVYVDSNVMAGRAGPMGPDGRFEGLVYLPCTAENNFIPELPKERVDIIYLCFPNNPTGMVLKKEELARWVSYARENGSLILFDAAYEAFITEPDVPHSIYEIEGAREVAVEFRSYSKLAGFTGLRCGYAVVPRSVKGTLNGKPVSLHDMWMRRQTTKFNGCPYIVQKAAEAVHKPQGQKECRKLVEGYMQNAGLIRGAFECLGLSVYGGLNAPYIWVRLPKGMDSWEFFDLLLNKTEIVGTPGSGFGPSGRGYFRLTGFGDPLKTKEACHRLEDFTL